MGNPMFSPTCIQGAGRAAISSRRLCLNTLYLERLSLEIEGDQRCTLDDAVSGRSHVLGKAITLLGVAFLKPRS